MLQKLILNRYQNAAQVREVLAILVNENVALEPVQKEQETALRIEKLDKRLRFRNMD